MVINKIIHCVNMHTGTGAALCVASDRSSLKRPALFNTFCLFLSISHMTSSAVPFANKYLHETLSV